MIVTATSAMAAAKMSGQSDIAAAIAERVLCAKMGRPPFAPFPLTIGQSEGYVTVRAAVKFADGRKCPPGSS